MLLRYSVLYLVVRGLPGLINFFAISVYTRLLFPEELGRYALVLTGVGLVDVVVFQWLRLVLFRLLPAHRENPQRFLGGVLALFLTLAAVSTGPGILIALCWPDPVWQRLLALAVPLLLAQAWFQMNLDMASACLEPARYGKLLSSKALLSLTVGGVLAWVGLGAAAPLVGLLVAYLVASSLFSMAAWRGAGPRWPEAADLREQLRYGLPLIATFALGWVVSGSDRLMLGWLTDEATVGGYAVGYDWAFQGLILILSIINTAAHPLAVNALEKTGPVEAQRQLAENGQLIIVVAFSGAVGLVILGPQMIDLLIGQAYRADALRLLPWVAVASALAGIKAYHFDIAFHLGRDSRWLMVTGGAAATTNLVLNLLLIPLYGILGAVWATLAAYGVAVGASAWWGRGAFVMPAILPLLAKGFVVASAFGFSSWIGTWIGDGSWGKLGSGLCGGLMAAFLAGLALDLCGLRELLWRLRSRWRGLYGTR